MIEKSSVLVSADVWKAVTSNFFVQLFLPLAHLVVHLTKFKNYKFGMINIEVEAFTQKNTIGQGILEIFE